ncbi:MAG: HPr family phosphocarrier protein [Phormidesmis sp.]
MQLGVRQGDRIRLLATKRDAQQAIQALQEAIELGLDEEETEAIAEAQLPNDHDAHREAV